MISRDVTQRNTNWHKSRTAVSWTSHISPSKWYWNPISSNVLCEHLFLFLVPATCFANKNIFELGEKVIFIFILKQKSFNHVASREIHVLGWKRNQSFTSEVSAFNETPTLSIKWIQALLNPVQTTFLMFKRVTRKRQNSLRAQIFNTSLWARLCKKCSPKKASSVFLRLSPQKGIKAADVPENPCKREKNVERVKYFLSACGDVRRKINLWRKRSTFSSRNSNSV